MMMKILLIALGVVLLFWLVAWLIGTVDKRTKEKQIQDRQRKKLEDKKAEEDANRAPWS